MRVLVGVKRVVDYAVKVRIQPDKAGAVQAMLIVPNHRRVEQDVCLLKLPLSRFECTST